MSVDSAIPTAGPTPPRTWSLLVLGALLCGFAVWREGSVSGQDEYWLTFRTPMEMLDRGDWWTPWLSGEPRLQKPPLLYWLICTSYEVLGRNLLAARLWSVLCGATLALLAARFDRMLFRRDGTLAALIVLSSVGVAVESRRAMLDLPMGCFAVLAVWCGARWLRSGRLRDLVAGAVALAAAMLVKGPVALLFAATAGIAAGLAARGSHGAHLPAARRTAHLLVAAAVLLGLTLPWPLSMAAKWPQLGEVLAEQTEARQFQFDPLSSFGPVVGGGLALILPWSLTLLAALFARRKDDPQRSAARWLIASIALSALPFLFMKSFERYLIPMVVPAAVLAARWLESASPRARRTHGVIALALLAIPTLALCGFTLWFGLAIAAPLLALLTLCIALRAAIRGAEPRRLAMAAAVQLALLLGAVYPAIGINALPDDLPADLAQRDVAVYRISQPGMVSLRAGHSVIAIRDGDTLTERLRGFDGYVFVADERADDFVAEARSAGLAADRVQSFRSFFSRKTWLRFARDGASSDDWWTAFRTRDLDALRPGFTCYRVHRA